MIQQRFVIYEKKSRPNDNIKKYHKVRDHCYYTGKYRRAAHNAYHLNYKESK